MSLRSVILKWKEFLSEPRLKYSIENIQALQSSENILNDQNCVVAFLRLYYERPMFGVWEFRNQENRIMPGCAFLFIKIDRIP